MNGGSSSSSGSGGAVRVSGVSSSSGVGGEVTLSSGNSGSSAAGSRPIVRSGSGGNLATSRETSRTVGADVEYVAGGVDSTDAGGASSPDQGSAVYVVDATFRSTKNNTRSVIYKLPMTKASTVTWCAMVRCATASSSRTRHRLSTTRLQ
ncbi:hypothetical protein PC128_g9055 [Phytophthora cactorum]|nr:hypothetical protein PC128_g9055 [Phytophthora cactorum]